MPEALKWATKALQQALDRCRALSYYREDRAPDPLCVFFSDGENTGGDVAPIATALKSVPFKGGAVDVIACAIEMQPKDLAVMQKIASRPELSFNIDQDRLADFIAAVEASVYEGKDPATLPANFRSR